MPVRVPVLVGVALAASTVACGHRLGLGEPTPPPPETEAGLADHRDVIYVPTPDEVVDAMLRLAGVGPEDVVYDLGSGDGRIVIRAAERHRARGVGIEIDPALNDEARRKAAARGVAARVDFRQQDFFAADLREATVVTLYLGTALNQRLRPKLLRELSPGARVVSHTYDMGGWKPDRTETVAGRSVYVWVVQRPVR
jgi:SAM-dependent methyltransferase